MTLFGHAFTHNPQEIQASSSTEAIPFSLTTIAPTGQTLSQSPYPKQPYLQDLSPPAYKVTAEQVFNSPSKSKRF